MSGSSTPENVPHSKRDKMRGFLKEGLSYSKDGMIKGKLVLEHSLGLGQKPNVVPHGIADVNGDHRTVEIGWHPVGGLGGKWFAEKTGLGKYITETVHKYPDPTQHWAVLVGEFAHELWMDEHLDVIYINERIIPDEWHTFTVGKTRFNDEALRQTGEMVIHNMRLTRPAYNIISNNCQNFAVAMLDAIQVGAHREFATSFAVYQAATGKGEIKDLFVDKHPEEQVNHDAGVMTQGADADEEDVQRLKLKRQDTDADEEEMQRLKLKRQDTVTQAQQVMDQETTKLDDHHKFFS